LKIWSLIIVVALIGTGSWYYTQQSSTVDESAGGHPGGAWGGNAPVVELAPVERRAITDVIEALGTTQANESVILTAKVSDIVSRVGFEDGDFVRRGDILLELANDEQSALLEEARANLEDAETNLRRQQELGEKRLVPESEIDIARTRTDAARARLESIAARMQDRLVRAPFDGILGFREVSTGTLLTSNTPITTLDDISVIKLDFSVPEKYMSLLQTGYSIEATSQAYPGQAFNGEIRTINSRIDNVTRAVTARALIANEESILRPGMLLNVKIVTAERMSLTVPESAIMQVGTESYVFVGGPDNKAIKRVITIGARRVGYVEVLDGLSEGEQVIIEGAFKLRPMQEFKLKSSENGWSERSGGRPGSNFAGKTSSRTLSGT
jgi:membrane fusion protein (multidrug efflux system)